MGDDGRLSAAESTPCSAPLRHPPVQAGARSRTRRRRRGSPTSWTAARTWSTWAESAQVWARGHRLTAAVVVLLAGAGTLGGWAYLASRPPPLLTTIDAAVLIDTIDPLPVRGSGAAILVRTNLVLHAADPGDDLRAVALHGPGLDQPQVRQSGTQVAASNMLDCNAIADLTVPATFALTVERSDPWGRVVTRDITVTGLGADDAGTQIVRACLTRAADALQLRVVSYDGAAAAPLRLEIGDPTAVDLFTFGVAAALGAGGAFLHPPAAAPVSLPAGAVSTVSLAHDISDCFVRTSSYAHDWRPLLLDRDRAGDLGILVAASPRRYQRLGAATLVTLSALQRRAVVRAVADPCRDAPRLTYSVGAVAADRTTSSPTVKFTVRAAVPAGSIDLTGTAADGRWLGPGTLEGIARSAVAATTSAQVRWRIGSCDLVGQGSTPRLRADVRLGHRTYPYLLPVWQRSIRAAVAHACGQPRSVA